MRARMRHDPGARRPGGPLRWIRGAAHTRIRRIYHDAPNARRHEDTTTSTIPSPPITRRCVAYLDASGSETDRDEQLITVAGCILPVEAWEQLSAEWSLLLSVYRVRTYSASGCSRGRGDFEGLLARTRDRLTDELTEMVARHGVVAITSTMRLGDYRRVDARYVLYERAHGPYTMCATFVLDRFEKWLKAHGWPRGSASAFLEDGDNGRGGMCRMIDFLQWSRHPSNPIRKPKRVRGPGSSFAEYVRPFEVADLVAHTVRRRILGDRFRPALEPVMLAAWEHQHLWDEMLIEQMCIDRELPRRSP
jgi:hypothetical protein